MPRQCSGIVLSRFFDRNVRLVAGMCERCYEECEDVRIIGVNCIFLKQIGKFDELMAIIEETTGTEMFEHGFSENELEFAVKRAEEFNEIVEEGIKEIEALEEPSLMAKSERRKELDCRGFTETDVKVSTEDVRNVVNACNEIKRKLCRRINMRALRNTSKTRSTRKSTRKTTSKVSKRTLKDDQSKYFSISFDNNNSEVVVKKDDVKVGNIKQENQCQHFKVDTNKCKKECCIAQDPKQEFVNYESRYFSNQQREGVIFQAEGSVKIESDWKKFGFEDGVVEHKPPVIFVPPKSPHNLIEEYLYHDPWALLVATIFLNRTSCMCARPYVFWFLSENPGPFSVLEKYPRDLEKYFVRLGLQKTRAVQVWRMSHDFVYKKWNNVKELYGIGVYGDDAFRMFCLGDFSVQPKDRFLKIYKAWYQKVAKKGF